MPEQTAITATENQPETIAHAQTRSKFFLFMSGVLFVTVLAGFSRTLYLRPYFEPPVIPTYLYVHGAVLTAWFLLFFVQTTLIASNRTDVHRRLGILGVALAVAVMIVSCITVFTFVPRMLASGADIEADLGFLTQVLWGNITLLIVFPSLVIRAIYVRNRPEAHKRLMLLASISMVSPAISRVTRFPLFDGIPEPIFGFLGVVALTLALVSYDLLSRKRLHPETLWGVPFFFATIIFCGLFVPTTNFGRSLVTLLW